jgi:hypothetical protein
MPWLFPGVNIKLAKCGELTPGTTYDTRIKTRFENNGGCMTDHLWVFRLCSFTSTIGLCRYGWRFITC